MSGLVREEPSENKGGGIRLSARYADDLEKVRTEPGAWFRLIDYSATASASTQASGSAVKLRMQTSGFEFKAASGKVYVRWVGEA